MASAFFGPALAACLPRVVGEGRLGEANSLSRLGGGVTMVLGPACGALVLSVLGYAVVFAVNAASFAVSACLIALSAIPSVGNRSPAERLAGSVAQEMRYARRNRAVLAVLAVVILAHLSVGALSVALPFLAASLVGSATRNLGYLEGLMGAGMVAGSVATTRMGKMMKDGSLVVALAVLGVALFAAGILEVAGTAGLLPFLACSAAVGGAVAAAAVFCSAREEPSSS